MKKLFISALMILVCGCGTDQGEGVLYTYTVVNKSNKAIRIEGYHSKKPTVDPIVTFLNIGDSLTKTYQSGLPPVRYLYGDFFGETTSVDSLKVIFYGDTSEKVLYYTFGCTKNKLNPLNHCIYNGAKETFLFTKEHFENAQPCNDCE